MKACLPVVVFLIDVIICDQSREEGVDTTSEEQDVLYHEYFIYESHELPTETDYDDSSSQDNNKPLQAEMFEHEETENQKIAHRDHPGSCESGEEQGSAAKPFFGEKFPYWKQGWLPPMKKQKQNSKFSVSDSENSVEQKYLEPVPGGNKYGHGVKYPTNKMDSAEKKQYKAELKAGDKTRMMQTSRHRWQPEMYRIYDLGRRFVPQYPYREMKQENHIEDDDESHLIPKRAPPELVLAIAKQSELIQNSRPVDPNEHLIKKESLRNGQYWNAYWKEEVEDPASALRTPHNKHNRLDTVSTKLSPGTPVYEYVSKLNKLYPKLLYVINKRNN